MRLAELLATRLCHDLSGPLNTLMGALELAIEDSDVAAEALPLAGDAAVVLGQRLKLLRAAWGGAGSAMTAGEIQALAAGLPGRNLQLEMADLPADAVFSSQGARLLLNALMLAAESLPGGGTIHVSGDAERHVVVQIEGNTASWPAGFLGYLTDPEAARRALTEDGGAGPRRLQGPILALLASTLGLRVSVLLGAGVQAAPPLLLDMQVANPALAAIPG